jgi:hypothetical protein
MLKQKLAKPYFKFALWLTMVFAIPIAEALTLQTATVTYDIDPNTLQITALTEPHSLIVNAGMTAKVTELIKQSATELHWRWPEAKVQINIKVIGDDLHLSIVKTHSGELLWYASPTSNEYLLMPLSEGMRINVNDPQWTDYLVNHYSEVNTTYDLKMPFWSQQQDMQVFSWLIAPYNNTLTFSQQQQQLGLRASHQFDDNEDFKVILHYAKDELSGARRYRQYLIEQHQFTTLAQKFKHYPEGKKIIGALHSYLFGDALLDVEDVKDWGGLIAYLNSEAGNNLQRHFSREGQKILVTQSATVGHLNHYEKRVITLDINTALNALFPPYGDANSPNVVQQQSVAAQQQLFALQQQLGSFLVSNENWGQGLSVPVIQALTAAGLNNLWLGVNKWTSAFYHPLAIDLAKSSGYLIGPYDSYNTAIPKGLNDTWLSARLPDAMREKCAVVKVDGKKQLGFQQSGYYLNPNCEVKIVQQRINDIMQLGKFNSYFIDVDATAMVREDYNPGNPTSAEQMTTDYNQRMQWIADQHKTVLGSEDGNALTQQGIIFAHGMETTGFGWRDEDMRKDRQSPYYLGRWYPDHKPEFFFKSAKVKAPYKTLLFAPENRLPLYQTVFHDAVINSHHWTMDNLKFSDVRVQRDLIGMLYNTPPMVNLSRDGLSTRIKALQHYQLGFSAAHRFLWDKALVQLLYLSEDKKIQQTQFSDGSTITANFSERAFTLNSIEISAHSIFTELANGQKTHWQSQ